MGFPRQDHRGGLTFPSLVNYTYTNFNMYTYIHMYTFTGHEFEQTLGDGRGQSSLEDYSPWSHSQMWHSDWTTHTHGQAYLTFLPFEDTTFFTNWRFAATLGYQMVVSLFFGLSWVLLVAFRIFDLSCDMWDLVPWPGMEHGPLHCECRGIAIGPTVKSHVLYFFLIFCVFIYLFFFFFTFIFISWRLITIL